MLVKIITFVISFGITYILLGLLVARLEEEAMKQCSSEYKRIANYKPYKKEKR